MLHGYQYPLFLTEDDEVNFPAARCTDDWDSIALPGDLDSFLPAYTKGT